MKIDIKIKLLKRGTVIRIGSNPAEVWVEMRIEKLPKFYFGCGRIGHLARECSNLEAINKGNLEYGAWMKRDMAFRSKAVNKKGTERRDQ